MTLDLNQLQVDSFSTSVAGDPSQWGAGTIVMEGSTGALTCVSCAVVVSHDVTQPHVCRTTTTF